MKKQKKLKKLYKKWKKHFDKSIKAYEDEINRDWEIIISKKWSYGKD